MKLSPEERAYVKRVASLGGKARAKALTKAQRVEIASQAGKARWDKVRADKALAS